MEMGQLKKRNQYLEKEVQTLSLAKLEERRKGVLEGITGCRQLVTPVGHHFLYILWEELIISFLKSPALLTSLAGAMVELLDEGRCFALEKLGLTDSNRIEDLDELLATFSRSAAALGLDEFLPANYP